MMVCVMLLLTLYATGCTGPKFQMDARAIDGMMQPVMDRHDAYVTRDQQLSPTERETYLRSSALLRSIQDTAMQRGAVVPTTATGRTR